ncbi:MAG: DUF2608 domain-containing protein [Gammaproteobacteria bacterium]|nr:DUF2608 domain-containing protein [Gammaproteobacteria bacterium]
MQITKLFVLALLATFSSLSFAATHQIYQTNNFNDVVKTAKILGNKYGNQNVLLIFDMDNTLVVGNHRLGSVPWWNWQSRLLTTHPNSKLLAAHTFKGLLKVQGILFNLYGMHLVDPKIAPDITNLQREGYKAIVLSLRGDSFRSISEQTLEQNHLNFIKSAIGPYRGYPGTYYPYRLNNLARYGISKNLAKEEHLGKARPISYMNGILMAEGLNKGAMLLALLKKTQYQPKAIIFVDDLNKNVINITDAFQKVNIETVAFRYGKEDKFVANFNKNAQAKAAMTWNKIKRIMA